MLLSQSAWEKKNSKHLSKKKVKRLTGRSNVNCKQRKNKYYLYLRFEKLIRAEPTIILSNSASCIRQTVVSAVGSE